PVASARSPVDDAPMIRRTGPLAVSKPITARVGFPRPCDFHECDRGARCWVGSDHSTKRGPEMHESCLGDALEATRRCPGSPSSGIDRALVAEGAPGSDVCCPRSG